MRITIHRSRYLADGWTQMEPLTVHEPPAEAYASAGRRTAGPVAPTRSEILDACRRHYCSGASGQIGRIRVDGIDVVE